MPTRFQQPGLHKEICRYWDSNQHSLFPKATANTRTTSWAAEKICRCWDSKQNSLFPKATDNTRSTTWTAERNMPILGLELSQFISEGYCQHAFNYLGWKKKYADIGTRTNTVNSEGYCWHALNSVGCRKNYADIGTRTNTVYIRRPLPTRAQLPGL